MHRLVHLEVRKIREGISRGGILHQPHLRDGEAEQVIILRAVRLGLRLQGHDRIEPRRPWIVHGLIAQAAIQRPAHLGNDSMPGRPAGQVSPADLALEDRIDLGQSRIATKDVEKTAGFGPSRCGKAGVEQ